MTITTEGNIMTIMTTMTMTIFYSTIDIQIEIMFSTEGNITTEGNIMTITT